MAFFPIFHRRSSASRLDIVPAWQERFATAGMRSATDFFKDERVVVWRRPGERENCVLDLEIDGTWTRFHVKRDVRIVAGQSVIDEVPGVRLLESAGIPSIDIVAVGTTSEGLGVVVSLDLAGMDDVRHLLRRGTRFDEILDSTADVAGMLHAAGLHHRDLYLNHFFAADPFDKVVPMRLIDAVRVRRVPRFLSSRWLVKDLGQFVFSTFEHDVGPDLIDRWLIHYSRSSRFDAMRHKASILRRARWIRRHDDELKRTAPTRNVEMPPSLRAGRGRQ
jgi:hypothetical protein